MQRLGSRLRWNMMMQSPLRRFSALHCSKKFLSEKRNTTNGESSMTADMPEARMGKVKDQLEKKTRRVTKRPPNLSVYRTLKVVRPERVEDCHEPKLPVETCTRLPHPEDPSTNQWTSTNRKILTRVLLPSLQSGKPTSEFRSCAL